MYTEYTTLLIVVDMVSGDKEFSVATVSTD